MRSVAGHKSVEVLTAVKITVRLTGLLATYAVRYASPSLPVGMLTVVRYNLDMP